MRIKFEDLPQRLQDQVRCKLAGEQAHEASPASPVIAPAKTSSKPTDTEAEYARLYLAGKTPLYEALTFRLANGHRYTPDWVCVDGAGRLVCVEVKGAYKLGSYQRARMAFDQAAIEWPMITWVWAEKRDGDWQQKTTGGC